jgi:hypothetical protein
VKAFGTIFDCMQILVSEVGEITHCGAFFPSAENGPEAYLERSREVDGACCVSRTQLLHSPAIHPGYPTSNQDLIKLIEFGF